MTTVGSLVEREHGINLWMVFQIPTHDFDEDEEDGNIRTTSWCR